MDYQLFWSAVGAVGTVLAFLSATCVAVFLYLQSNKTEKARLAMQKNIAQRDVEMKLYNERLAVYNTILEVYTLLLNTDYERVIGLGYFQQAVNFTIERIQVKGRICVALNKSKMLFPGDIVLHQALRSIFDEVCVFVDLSLRQSEKVNKLMKQKMMEGDAQKVALEYLQALVLGDTDKLNAECEDIVFHLECSAKKLISLMSDENFDDHFKKYLHKVQE